MQYKTIILILLAFLLGCEQVPTSLDEEPYLEGVGEVIFEMNVRSFDFDYFTRSFFAASTVTSPHDDLEVTARLFTHDSLVDVIQLNDDGTGSDIQAGDNSFDLNWILPDSLNSKVEEDWKLEVEALSGGENLVQQLSLSPEIPRAPIIESISHRDTLQLLATGLLLDTITVTVSHPGGLDEIRDVSLLSLKPDSTWSNDGQPIQLHDDGGETVFFTYMGIDISSGDRIRGDGVYSLVAGWLNDANTQTGKYYWEFNARTWEGIKAEPVKDSLVVLDPGLSKRFGSTPVSIGVFQ